MNHKVFCEIGSNNIQQNLRIFFYKYNNIILISFEIWIAQNLCIKANHMTGGNIPNRFGLAEEKKVTHLMHHLMNHNPVCREAPGFARVR